MPIAVNGPPVLNGSAYVYPQKTLYQLRRSVIRRLGFSAQVDSPPPGMNELIDEFLQDAHEQLYQRYPLLRQYLWFPIAITQGNRFYDIPYNDAYIERTDIAIVNGTPDTITTAGGDFVAAGFAVNDVVSVSGSAADDGFHTVAGVATGTLTLSTTTTVTGETAGNMLRVAGNEFANIDPREIVHAGLLDGTIWNEMIGGIPPELFNIDQQQRPTHYEVREFVEVYPEPDQAYTLYLKGRTGLKPFTANAHTTSIDPHVVFLQALAQSKAHYGQGDSSIYFQQLEALIGNYNAGTFGTKRYIPNTVLRGVNLPLPKVTFPR